MKSKISYKNLLPLLALLIFTGQANLAQAQHYFVVDYGTIINDGSNADAYGGYEKEVYYRGYDDDYIHNLSNNVEAKHQGNITRLAYGYQLDEKTYLEIGRSNLGEVEYKYNHNDYIITGKTTGYSTAKEAYDYREKLINVGLGGSTGTPCNHLINGTLQTEFHGACSNTSSFHRYAISAFDVSAIYRYQLNDKVDLLARAGIALYEWERLEGTVAPAIKTRAAETLLLGFGAEFGKIRAEYRLYNIPHILLNDNTEYKLYSKVGIFSIGYKFEF